tara:strand:+ start:518 stop:757 length:240 start_codon:yes stop_codon:yes gene_type:complete
VRDSVGCIITRLLVSGVKLKPAQQKGINMTQEQVLLRIRTAVNIITGDDGHTGEKVLDTFVRLCEMTEEEYQKEVEYYG